AVDAALRVLERQNGPTVLAGHSFSGMIVTEAGVHPNVSALVYVAARAPDAGEDYAALAKQFPTPPASAGIVFDGDEGRLSEEAFPRDFGATCRKRRQGRSSRCSGRFIRPCSPAKPPTWHGGQSQAGTPCPRRIGPSTLISSVSWQSEWPPRRSRSRRVTFR